MRVYSRINADGQIIWYLDWYPTGHKRDGRERIPLNPELARDRESAERIAQVVADTRRADLDIEEPSSGTRIRDLWPGYVAHQRIHANSRRTADDIELAGKHWISILGNVDVRYMTEGHITLYKSTRQSEVKNRTINKELSWFSGFRKWVRKSRALPLPVLDLEYLPAKRPIPIVLSVDEVRSIFNYLKPDKRVLFSLIYILGLRKKEACSIRCRDVDRDNGQVIITGKGDRDRLQPIPPWLMDELSTILPADRERYVFESRSNKGHPVYDIREPLANAVAAAGIKKRVTVHLLRHSCATHMLEQGVDIRDIQAYLGHSTITTTVWYTQVAMQNKKKASDKLSHAFVGGDNGRQQPKAPKRKK